MKHYIALSILVLSVLVVHSKCDLLECDDKILPSLSEEPGVLKKWGCDVKEGAKKLGEKVKESVQQLNEHIKERVKKFATKAKEVGSDIKTKFNDLKEHLHKDSNEMIVNDTKMFKENVELINPDILKADQECGHGHILDSLGNCRKLRK